MTDGNLQLNPFDDGCLPNQEYPPFLKNQLITYIGNKRALLNFIGKGVSEVAKRLNADKLSCYDVFSGSGVVARYLKRSSKRLYCSDLENYSEVVNKCYLKNLSEIDLEALSKAIAEINHEANKHPSSGFISKLYSPKNDTNIKQNERAVYTRRNAVFIDTARKLIKSYSGTVPQYMLLAPLIYVASVHANNGGVFKGFYKNSKTGIGQFGGNGKDALKRIMKPFNLPVPIFSRFECPVHVLKGDANSLVKTLPEVDLAYIDPPYNQHPYGANYFMLNLIANYQQPSTISNVSGIPTDWNRSAYNKKLGALSAFTDLVQNVAAKYLLISFNSEGFISNKEMLATLFKFGKVKTLATKYNTYRGSRNLKNRNTHVTEFLYLVEKT